MTPLSRIFRKLHLLLWAVVFWALPVATLLAKSAPEEEPATKEGYTLSYALVILGVALGVLVVCKSSPRRDREWVDKTADEDD